MPRAARILVGLILLAVTAFCVFGFLNTADQRGAVATRVIYTAVGFVSLLAGGGLLFSSLGGSSDDQNP